MTKVKIKGKDYQIDSQSGIVVDSNKQREIHVYGSNHSIDSTTTVHDSFFLIDNTGQEYAINLSNWDINLRTGHNIQLIYLTPPKEKNASFVLFNNLSLKEINSNNKLIKDISKKHYYNYFGIGLFSLIFIGAVFKSTLLLFTLAIASYLIYLIITKQIFNEIMQAIEKEIQ